MACPFKDLQIKAEAAGWTIRKTAKNHLRWEAPDGKTAVVTSGTPSDHRSYANTRAQLRRAGLDC